MAEKSVVESKQNNQVAFSFSQKKTLISTRDWPPDMQVTSICLSVSGQARTEGGADQTRYKIQVCMRIAAGA